MFCFILFRRNINYLLSRLLNLEKQMYYLKLSLIICNVYMPQHQYLASYMHSITSTSLFYILKHKISNLIFLLTVPRRYFFCRSFMLFLSCVSHAFASVYCCLVVTCWERADLLALVGDVYCIFVTFPCGILGQDCIPSWARNYNASLELRNT